MWLERAETEGLSCGIWDHGGDSKPLLKSHQSRVKEGEILWFSSYPSSLLTPLFLPSSLLTVPPFGRTCQKSAEVKGAWKMYVVREGQQMVLRAHGQLNLNMVEQVQGSGSLKIWKLLRAKRVQGVGGKAFSERLPVSTSQRSTSRFI